MTDVVKRLRELEPSMTIGKDCKDAADEIEQLHHDRNNLLNENERLRAELSKQQSLTKAGLDLLDARKNRTNRELTRLTAERDRALDQERERCARVCDKHAERNFPWGSENSDIYHAQAAWAQRCAKAIRALEEPK